MSNLIARKTWHLCAGMVIPIAALFVPRNFLLVFVAVATAVALAAETARFFSPALNHRFTVAFKRVIRQQEISRVTGSTYILISSLLTLIIFPRDIAILALTFLAVGDSVGAVVGFTFSGEHQSFKNWQSSLACFLSSILAGLIFIIFFIDISIFVLIAGALTATIVEALPLPVNDNVTIPIFSALAMSLYGTIL
ncbi:MAG: hypothetical protein Q8P44_08540 [Dehalococcoidia bacterium]|nr:hypothetical protein [Dehalococcoidia bacterium]